MSDTIDFNCECDDDPSYETLLELRTRMMDRLGYAALSSNPPPGMDRLLDDFLRSAQRILYSDPNAGGALHTERFFRWTMAADTRYYGIADSADSECPRQLDRYKVSGVWYEDLNGAWYPLTRGINPALYTQALTNNGEPSRFEIRQCIEVYPAPRAAYTLWVKGHFGLQPFTANGDPTTIDSELVFLLALGNAKRHYGKPDATDILTQANTYKLGLIAGGHGGKRYVPPGYSRMQANMTRPLFLPDPTP